MNNIKEKRSNPRAQVNRPGRIRVAGGPESNIQIIDISENGGAFFYSKSLDIGTAVEIQFSLNFGERKTAFDVQGQVRHYLARGDSHVIGVEFTNFIVGAAVTIREFVESKLASTSNQSSQ